MNIKRFLSLSTLLLTTIYSAFSQCVVGGTEFNTSTTLFNPTGLSNDGDGWFSEDLGDLLDAQCKKTCNYYVGANVGQHRGMPSNSMSSSGSMDETWDKLIGVNPSSNDPGFAAIVANPRIISPYLSEGSGSNMLMFFGNGSNTSVLTYTVSGLEPNSVVSLSADVYNLVSYENMEAALFAINDGVINQNDLVKDIKLGNQNFSMQSSGSKLTAGSGKIYSDGPQLWACTEVLYGQPSGDKVKTNNLGWGEKTTLNLTSSANKDGVATFYFIRDQASFAPLGLDNIEIMGELAPQIKSSGTPCPKMDASLMLKSTYPKGTKYSWTGTGGVTSSEQSLIFFPSQPDDYTFTCTIETPEGCKVTTPPYTLTVGACCDDGAGNPMKLTDVYLDDFGRFQGNVYTYRDKRGFEQTVTAVNTLNGTGSHGPCIDDQLNGGKAFPSNIKYAENAFYSGGYAIGTEDAYTDPSIMFDASGENGGGFLMIDMGGKGWMDKVIYEQEITDLCSERLISFSAAIGSINDAKGSWSTNATIQLRLINADDGSVIEAEGVPIDETYALKTKGWETVKKYDFTLPAGVDRVKIQIISKEDDYGDPNRGDIAIDNIIFRVCTPPTVGIKGYLSPTSKAESLEELCVGDEFILEAVASSEAKAYYEKPTVGYLFQYSKKDPSDLSFDPKTDWIDLGTPQTEDKYTITDPGTDPIFASLDNKEKLYFRVVMGEIGYLTAQRSLWESLDDLSPCRNVSFSTKFVEASKYCAECAHLNFETSGATFTATGGGKFNKTTKVVELCEGESVTLGISDKIEGTDSNSDPYHNYVVGWYKGDLTSPISGAKKTCSDSDYDAPTIDVSYNDVTANGVKYIISFHDNYDPNLATTPCDFTEEIIVKANPTPNKDLISPDPFCEGTLKEEPTKTISKYNIHWYATEDDGNKDENELTAAPVVKDVKAADGEQIYYYVVEDATTLCRAEAKEYKFSSMKADDLNLVNRLVSYRKNQASIESLEKQLPTIGEGMSTDYKLMWGLVKGADTDVAPDLETATLETAKAGYPKPTVKDKTSPNPEYLWYYVYQVSPDGCLSDTILVKVEIIGAPTPKVKNGEFCSTETPNKLSDFAKIDAPDGNESDYTLKFYEADGTTEITDPSFVPDISTPGEYKFFVSQVSASGGESVKKAIVITSYGVRDLVTPTEVSKYCKDAVAKNVETFVSEAAEKPFYKSTDDGREFFTTEPTKNAVTTGAASSMPVKTNAAGEYTYYVRNTYTITSHASESLITNSSTCYGDHQEYKVEVQEVLPPTGTFNVSYLKSDGESGGFKKPLTQEPEAVKASGTNTLVWYKDKALTTPTTEEAATPVYKANLVGNEESVYYVTQKNELGCESEAVKVTITVSGFPQPTVTPLDICEKSNKLTGTLADYASPKATDANVETDFELVWYESKSDGTIDLATETTTAPSLDPAIQKPQNGQSKTVYTYFVLQRLKTDANAAGAPATITVTINAVPVLKVAAADPICGSKNESIDLADMYTENTKPSFSVISEYQDEASAPVSNTKVTKRGTYKVQASYKLTSGESCVSESLPLKVFVHEVTPTIVGSETTCPGEAVELTSEVETEGAVLNDIKYYWSNNKSAEKGSEKTYNTGAEGLETSGNEMRVTLKVDAGACKGIEAPVHVIKVDMGQLDGTIAFSEKNNDTPKTPVSVKTSNIIFTSCGSNVTVDVNVTATEDGFSYTKNGGSEKTGTLSAGSTSLSLPAGKYEFKYINRCPTWFSFTIVDVSTKVEEVKRSDLDVCEGEKFNVQIKVTPKTTGYPYDITWLKDGAGISGETNEVFNIASTVPANSGVYSYEVKSAGCLTTGKVADGLPLTVKPFIKIDKSSLVRVYEEIRENPVAMSIPFIEPSDPTPIESDIIWTDEKSSMVMSGSSASIPSLESDHYFNIKVSSDGYCDDTAAVKVLVDAKLQMSAELDVEEMCVNENHKITIDTTGTGRVLHKKNNELVLKVEESVAGGTPSVIKLLPSGDKLSATISPKKDAQYTVTYSYTVGSQNIVKTLPIKVHEAFDVQFNVEKKNVCEGETAEITVTKLFPAGTRLEWENNDEILNMSDAGATVMPTFTLQDGYTQNKRYAAVATNDICTPKTYYPMVIVSKPIEGEIVANDYICEGTKLKLDASSFNAEKYTWYSDDQLGVGKKLTTSVITVMPIPNYAEYYLDMERGACKASASHAAVVTYAPKLDYVDSLSFRDVEIVLQSGTGTEPFMYIVDGKDKADDVNSAVKHDLEYGNHDLKIVDAAGCVVKEKFKINDPVIKIPVEMSPNDDGVNDIFKITALKEAYPSAIVSIYDRWGKRIAYYRAADTDGWDGTYNGKPLPSTDYWYEVEIKELSKTYTGHFTLLRQ